MAKTIDLSKITWQQIEKHWRRYAVGHLADILQGTYDLKAAQQDILSLIEADNG